VSDKDSEQPTSAADIRMVDVTSKEPSRRRATAAAEVRLAADTVERILSGQLPKGDVTATARLAGIMAAKQTPQLLPLCHSVALTHVGVNLTPIPSLERVCLQAVATAVARTGVEMEALTAAAVAALTVYDMCKGVDRAAEIRHVRLLTKAGGYSGCWRADGVGRVVAVSLSEQRGTRKHNVEEITLDTDMGVRGDAHAGPGLRQVSLLANESIATVRARGLEVGPGDFAENITTEGLALPSLPIGTHLLLGASAVGAVTQIGKECESPCEIGRQLGDCVMPREGIFVRVVQPGKLRAGDLIQVLTD